MNSEFDDLVDRTQTNSLKWDYRKEVFGRDDVLPLWVADSDWKTAQPIIDAIIQRAKHGVFGYTKPGKEATRLVVDWVRENHGWTIDPEWVVFTNGVVPSLSIALRANIKKGDGVIVQSPVYYPFFEVVDKSGAGVVTNELILDGTGYRMDYRGLDRICKYAGEDLPVKPKPKVLLLCNPHNPVGRVWAEEELLHLAEICLENELLLISDDIHAEFTYGDNRYTPIASLDEEVSRRSVTLLSPSKAFNTAGIPAGVAVIPDPLIRKKFNERKSKLLNGPSIFGLVALKAAYGSGDGWLERQLAYLEDNIEFTLDAVEGMPGVEAFRPEGTTLIWLDFRGLELTDEELEGFLVDKAKVGLDMGSWFGPGGEGFARLNVACQRETVKEGLSRISRALEDI
ncbi:MAG: MalY/PatB family protein [Candidatus Acetothermia bacterium]